jgi:hypothetical protein
VDGYSVVFGLILAGSFVWVSAVAARLRNIERKLDRLSAELGISLSTPMSPSEAVRLLAQDPARRIDAIREYRRQSGADLREAVEVIDGLRSTPSPGA